MAKKKTPSTARQIKDILDAQVRLEKNCIRNFSMIHEKLKVHNKILQEHHDRSVQLKRDNDLKELALREEIEKNRKEYDLRLSKVEAPHKWLELTKSGLLYISAIAGAISIILKLVKVAAE